MLKIQSMPEKTNSVFSLLKDRPELSDFTLIGGTALSLQINHRMSEDLDFWVCREKLKKESISSLIRQLQDLGVSCELVTPKSAIVSAKINGYDLLSYSQDYSINGVKVTFFSRQDTAYKFFDKFERIKGESSFGIMNEDGIFHMKSYVIHKRTRSRDLFDLKSFVEKGRSINDAIGFGPMADPSCSKEYAKSVLKGDIPLDKEDEGFSSIGLKESIDDIYSFFKKEISKSEEVIAESIYKNSISKWKEYKKTQNKKP